MNMSVKTTPSPSETQYATAFEFIKSLAAELSRGKVDLPSFPEIAVRVRRIMFLIVDAGRDILE